MSRSLAAWATASAAGGCPCRHPNGTFVEDVLAAVRDRLVWYQAGPYACGENAEAIAAVDEALAALASRRADRVRRGVDGTHAD